MKLRHSFVDGAEEIDKIQIINAIIRLYISKLIYYFLLLLVYYNFLSLLRLRFVLLQLQSMPSARWSQYSTIKASLDMQRNVRHSMRSDTEVCPIEQGIELRAIDPPSHHVV